MADELITPTKHWFDEVNETLAIAGVLVIAVVSMYACKVDVSAQIASNVVSGLIGYMGRGRANGK